MFTTVFWITATAFVTATAGIIAALPVIWEPTKKGWIKFNLRGYVFIACSILLVILPVALYMIQSRSDEEERDARDAALRKEYQKTADKQQKSYEASVSQMRKDFGDSNYRTLAVIGKILAGYNLRVDTAERRLKKFVSDSVNGGMLEQPTLGVSNDLYEKGITFLKFENNEFHYKINFLSVNGASCCFNLKISAEVLDTFASKLYYKGPVRNVLAPTDMLAKAEDRNWTFTINNTTNYTWLYLWVRGTYSDQDGKHTYPINKVYYCRKDANTWGMSGPDVSYNVKAAIQQFEKD